MVQGCWVGDPFPVSFLLLSSIFRSALHPLLAHWFPGAWGLLFHPLCLDPSHFFTLLYFPSFLSLFLPLMRAYHAVTGYVTA